MEAATERIRLLLLDRDDAVRTALRRLLVVEGFEVAGECASLSRALDMVAQHTPCIVLMETQGLDANPLQACRELRAASPGTRVILLVSAGDIAMRVRGILAGADSCLPRDAGVEYLMHAIRAAAAGRHLLDGETLQWLRERANPAMNGPLRTQVLSPQEKKIVPLVAEGLTNKQIGEALGLSHKTVKNHLSSVFQKLQVSRRSQLAAIVAGSAA